jgi:hypothetical protein
MQVTVVSMFGLDTSNAIIRTQHAREDAIEFCREYIGEVSEKCIKDELATRLNDTVFAIAQAVCSLIFGETNCDIKGEVSGGANLDQNTLLGICSPARSLMDRAQVITR